MEYIPEEFTWFGFILGGIWLAYHKLWRPFLFFIIILVMLEQLEMADVITAKISYIILLGFCLYVGFTGQDMIRRRLERMGYELHDVVIASSDTEAGLKYLNGNFANES